MPKQVSPTRFTFLDDSSGEAATIQRILDQNGLDYLHIQVGSDYNTPAIELGSERYIGLDAALTEISGEIRRRQTPE